MFGKTVYEEQIGPLSYQVKSPKRGEFTLWLGGYRIGKPRENGDVWEFTAKTLKEAKEEMRASARRKLQDKIADARSELGELREALERIKQPPPARVERED